jgi:hypothetical protein
MSRKPISMKRSAAAAGVVALWLGCSVALASEAPGEKVTTLFKQFREWATTRELLAARRRMETAARDRSLKEHAETSRSLAAVARLLEERRAAIRKALEDLVGKEAEIKTSRGVRKGTVR